ncbi:MAG: ketoacyl-ACP synthase III [Thermoanaerobaculum sp.]|nr:ketoacyl-ACP synthase III [Thermoanaerobaculum sp.]MCX7895783.1 ketoacyl-ACP synthase III [Thermoanaerobaculum sp.]MDW7967466.1 ketoacyl-ACP synthase III [Thermoanaerobaculum sp.]
MERYAQLVGAGMFLPPREITNDALRAKFDAKFPEFVDKMEASSGIRSRFWAPEDWATSDVALPAAQRALAAAGKKPEEVDLIILGTDSPDYITPATSVVLQHKLQAKNAGTFDVGCACASFPTALAAAAGIITTSPEINTVLVVGVYLMHKLADPEDPMIFFYGDGAGAAVLEARTAKPGEPKKGFLASAFLADGSYHRHWGIYSGGTFEPATVESVQGGRTKVRLIERYPPEVNHEGWPRLVREVTRRAGVSLAEVDAVLFTQVRRPSVELVMETLGLPLSKTHTVMEKWGYTGSACIPMALVDAVAQGVVRPGQLVVFVGSGVGYNQAAAAFRLEEIHVRLD